MSLESDIDKLIKGFGDKLAKDLNDSLNQALKDGGGKNIHIAAQRHEPKIIKGDGSTTIRINASDDYWYYIEHGRKPGKRPPAKALGKKWQNTQGRRF